MIKPEGFRIEADPWEVLYSAYEKERTIDAQVTRITWPNGSPVWELAFTGLGIEMDGIRGLVPASETGLPSKDLMPRFVGQVVRVKVKGLQKDEGLVACSRLEAVTEAQKVLFENVKEEQIIDCVVRAVLPRSNVRPPRLIVDVGGGVLAEVPKRRASYSAAPLRAQFIPGRQVKAKVIKVDPQQGKIEVSIRDAYPDPWGKGNFRRGDIVVGKVCWVGTGKNGQMHVWVEVPPGVIGIAPYEPWVKKGYKVNVTVKTFNAEKRKLHLQLLGRVF